MFGIKMNMHNSDNVELVDSIDSISNRMGMQSVIYDYSTGISFRMVPVIKDKEFALSGFYLGYDRGFLGSSNKRFYGFSDESTYSDLIDKIKSNIDGLNLSRNDVQDLFEFGVLKTLSAKNPELKQIDGFLLALKMESLERFIEKEKVSYDQITELLESIRNGNGNIEDQAIDVLKKLYEESKNFRDYKQSISEKFGIIQQSEQQENVGAAQQSSNMQESEKTGAEKIIEFMKKEGLTSQDLTLALSMLLARQGIVKDAEQQIISSNDRKIEDSEYQI